MRGLAPGPGGGGPSGDLGASAAGPVGGGVLGGASLGVFAAGPLGGGGTGLVGGSPGGASICDIVSTLLGPLEFTTLILLIAPSGVVRVDGGGGAGRLGAGSNGSDGGGDTMGGSGGEGGGVSENTTGRG